MGCDSVCPCRYPPCEIDTSQTGKSCQILREAVLHIAPTLLGNECQIHSAHLFQMLEHTPAAMAANPLAVTLSTS
jgi:hypothetical protein